MPEPFEEMYAQARRPRRLPWANLAPDAHMAAWLASAAAPPPGWAIVVGCGLGDDAEEAARRGHRVTAFDVSPTAIDRCRERFPGSTVEYLVADVLDLPVAWTGAWDVVIDNRTVQSLEPVHSPRHRRDRLARRARRRRVRPVLRARRRHAPRQHPPLAPQPPRPGGLRRRRAGGGGVRRPGGPRHAGPLLHRPLPAPRRTAAGLAVAPAPHRRPPGGWRGAGRSGPAGSGAPPARPRRPRRPPRGARCRAARRP